MDTKELGNFGEELACGYLVKNGYKILGRNCDFGFGEIDIVAKKKGLFSDKTIHFVEVKTLSSKGPLSPEEKVNYKKQNKYKRLVEAWMEKNKYPQDFPCQVDVVAIAGDDMEFFENIISDN